jgi:phasin family protein
MARKGPASARNESSSQGRKRAAAARDATETSDRNGGAGAGDATGAPGAMAGDDDAGERRASADSETEGSAGAKGSRTRTAADPAALAKMMTPERAVELYKANAGLALEVINAAIEGTSRLRRKQFEGEEAAREFQRRQVRSAAQARDPQSLVAAQQGATQEAVERSMRYWSEMFELIVEIQKRLFTLMQEQMETMPGVRETRVAMTMFPDLGEMQKVVSAMQGVLTSGASTFEAMQRAMGGGYARRGQGRDESGR